MVEVLCDGKRAALGTVVRSDGLLVTKAGELTHNVTLSQLDDLPLLSVADLFLLLCFMEAIGLPNPTTLYLFEVYPYLLEQFHLWHRRMGIDHSPVGALPCC